MCSCIEFIMKYVLFIANLIFFLVGGALAIIGIVVLVQLGGLSDVFEEIQFIPVWITAVGGVVVLISFFGCCGAAKENKCMLYFYSILMLILIGTKIWIATEIFRNLSNVHEWVIRSLERLLDSGKSDVFELIHVLFRCCGTTGPQVFLNIPATCCAVQPCTLDNSFDGCNELVTDYFNSFGALIGSFVITAICVEFIAVLFAVVVANTNRRQNGKVY